MTEYTNVEVVSTGGRTIIIGTDANGKTSVLPPKEAEQWMAAHRVETNTHETGSVPPQVKREAEPLKPMSITESMLQAKLKEKPNIHIEVPAPEPKKEKKNLLTKVKNIFRKKTPEEKAAKAEAKAEKEEAKRQKKIEKAEKKYEKAVAKAEKKLAKDPHNPEAQEKYAETIAKAENKRDKKLEKLGALKDELTEVKEPELKSTVQPIPEPEQPLKEGQFRDVYGNIRNGNIPQARENDAYPRENEPYQQNEQSPQEELMMLILEAIMRSYLGPEYGYWGDRMSMRDDMTDAYIDRRTAEAELQNQQTLENVKAQDDLTNTQTVEQPAPAVVEVDRTPLTDKEQKSFDSWMKTCRISDEDKNQLIEKYGPKDAYDIVQKCMAEPTNVMVTAGQEPTKSKQAIEYFAKLDVTKQENRAMADNIIMMDPPKFNPTLMMQKQRA